MPSSSETNLHHHCLVCVSTPLVPRRINHGTRLHPAPDVEDRTGPRTATSPTRRATTANVSDTRRDTARTSRRRRSRSRSRSAEVQTMSSPLPPPLLMSHRSVASTDKFRSMESLAPELGRCVKSKAHLTLKPDAKPVFRKARSVPHAALPRISQEIDRLVAADVLSPIDHSDWAAPIVAVQKKNGSIRLCADYSTGLNDALEQHQHPLPTPDDIFAKLNGGRYFSQLDLAEAYLQLEMDEVSRPLLTINTHRGLYRLNRLLFGVKPAPGISQQYIDALIAGLRIHDYGFRVRLEKCAFLQTEINNLGFVINAEGRRPDPKKIGAIHKMPHPKDVSQLRAFLGLVNFYGTFVKDLHNIRAPLDALTKKDAVYTWTPECQSSFDRIKATLKSDLLLTHFNPGLPIIVAADASNHGIGAVLSHRFPNGSEKAIYHASRALTPTQQKYSQIEKEALALVFAVQKFHRIVHGRHFTLRTDHKPLFAIFGSKKGVPVYSANRLQRWATTLLNYNFTIEQVIDYTRSGRWPKIDRISPLWHYYNRRDTFATTNDCLLTANRIVILKSLHRRVLASLHKAHPGQTRMKMLARSYVYWPSVEADIESLVRNCTTCAMVAKNLVKAELHSWPKPTAPWTPIHADFAGPLDGKYYLVIVDAFSKWPKIVQMNCISTSATIAVMKKIFAQFGNPQTLVTDNGTQFTSASFQRFCHSCGITHVRSPQFHPQSNGQAERFVDAFKRGLAKLKGEQPTADALQTFLMDYRSTPCPSGPNHLLPAENFLGRKLCTVLGIRVQRITLDHATSRWKLFTTAAVERVAAVSKLTMLSMTRTIVDRNLPGRLASSYVAPATLPTPFAVEICYGTATSTNYGHEAALLQSTNSWTCSTYHSSTPEPIPTNRRQRTQQTCQRRLFDAPHANAEHQTNSTSTRQRRRIHNLKGEVL
ncbi:hypothetical protein Y032_0006g3147 [Ancylostoma ceylanicum]|uniref:RNA-directed DNA polymerase n=1 Tax=Ancylostoma ceylanicum TaxID=53326 RepID=A0A016VQY0_9BILA|nr:hypothetical protein Y032_0006g3147 [Ancylostoma ceylanicum]